MTAARPERPSGGELACLGLIALLMRVAFFLTVSLVWHVNLQTYADAGDGASYQAYARAIFSTHPVLSEYDSRVFPGYGLLIGLTHEATRLPIPAAGLAVAWTGAAAATVFTALALDRRAGWAMVPLTPYWISNSSLLMSEAPMLGLTMAGLWLGMKKQSVMSGIVLGLACMVRPVACFALLGLVLAQWLNRQHAGSVIIGVSAVAVGLTGLIIPWHLTGHFLQSARVYSQSAGAYKGPVLTWPFHSLIETPLRERVSVWRMGYIYLQVAMVLGGCVLAVAASASNIRNIVAATWLLGNTLFVLCIASGPYGWGFFHFPRFILCTLPALIYFYRKWLPGSAWFWLALAPIGFAAGVAGAHYALVSPPPMAMR